MDRRRLAVAGVHAGGFLGPFGGGVTAAMLPELGADFGVSAATASATITAYLVPFAALMLFSGTLGARWGLRRSVLGAYGVSVAGSVVCVLASGFPLLLVGRGVQGVANAFTTPLLLASIADSTPRERLGRTLGLFASMQAAGQTSAPLIGGLAAEANWRWAFVGVAAVAVGLAAVGLPSGPGAPVEPPRLRAAWSGPALRASAVALVGWGCLGGLTFLVAFRAGDAFGLGAGARGLLLTVFGVLGILSARSVGRLIERIGGRAAVLVGTVGAAVPVALMGVVPWLPVLVALWALAGVLAQFVQVGVNTLVLTGDEANPAGAVSVVQAFRFVGASLSPIALTPVYHASAVLGFLVPGLLLALVTPLAVTRLRPGSEGDPEQGVHG
ncbi:MFS transporter [Actinophytocola xanthii]|uniref:MFS transporter n=1 Tax=Actinophytocola xanthii TaxID=1912961 RepID=A0A1Q8CUQ7_9PSEU|nr:MFS transporter [Actinophytocola xanthii]OLF18101.1 MFS transporter [Actinophytocola xanthii]